MNQPENKPASALTAFLISLVSMRALPTARKPKRIQANTTIAVFQSSLLKSACRVTEKKMPPIGAPSVTKPIANAWSLRNQWSTTPNATVAGNAAISLHVRVSNRLSIPSKDSIADYIPANTPATTKQPRNWLNVVAQPRPRNAAT